VAAQLCDKQGGERGTGTEKEGVKVIDRVTWVASLMKDCLWRRSSAASRRANRNRGRAVQRQSDRGETYGKCKIARSSATSRGGQRDAGRKTETDKETRSKTEGNTGDRSKGKQCQTDTNLVKIWSHLRKELVVVQLCNKQGERETQGQRQICNRNCYYPCSGRLDITLVTHTSV
jgi:hypothetical protein